MIAAVEPPRRLPGRLFQYRLIIQLGLIHGFPGKLPQSRRADSNRFPAHYE